MRLKKSNAFSIMGIYVRAADVIEAITNSGLKYDESEDVVDVMCQAIQEMKMESEKKEAQEAAGKLL